MLSTIKYIRSKKGASLLEVIVAMAVMVLLVLGLISATTVSLRTSQFGQTKSTAIKYAQEGLELVRQQRDTEGWTSFVSRSGKYCLPESGVFPAPSPAPGVSAVCPINVKGLYTRSASFSWNAVESRMEVTVGVDWTDSEDHTTSFVSYFTQWR